MSSDGAAVSEYEVGVSGFHHVTVEASSDDEAKEKALDQIDRGEFEIDEVVPMQLSGPDDNESEDHHAE